MTRQAYVPKAPEVLYELRGPCGPCTVRCSALQSSVRSLSLATEPLSEHSRAARKGANLRLELGVVGDACHADGMHLSDLPLGRRVVAH